LSPLNNLNDMVTDISGVDLIYEPGTKWQYSIASDVQGALIEAVTGMKLDDYLETYIFAPLEMTDTGFWVPEEHAHRLVDQYIYDVKGLEPLKSFGNTNIEHKESRIGSDYLSRPKLLSGGSGLVSTAKDYSRFVQVLLNNGIYNGRQILSAELVDQMLTSHTEGLNTSFLPLIYENTGFGYGLGIKEGEGEGDLRREGSFYWAGKGGTVFWGDPKNNLSVIVMMQVEDGWVALERWLIPEIYHMIADMR